MTLRLTAAAALLALTAAGLAVPAQAAPTCRVTVMGLTFDNGCPAEAAPAFAPRRYDALRQADDAPVYATTGSTARRPAR